MDGTSTRRSVLAALGGAVSVGTAGCSDDLPGTGESPSETPTATPTPPPSSPTSRTDGEPPSPDPGDGGVPPNLVPTGLTDVGWRGDFSGVGYSVSASTPSNWVNTKDPERDDFYFPFHAWPGPNTPGSQQIFFGTQLGRHSRAEFDAPHSPTTLVTSESAELASGQSATYFEYTHREGPSLMRTKMIRSYTGRYQFDPPPPEGERWFTFEFAHLVTCPDQYFGRIAESASEMLGSSTVQHAR